MNMDTVEEAIASTETASTMTLSFSSQMRCMKTAPTSVALQLATSIATPKESEGGRPANETA